LTEDFPDRHDTTVTGGVRERAVARAALQQLVIGLRRIEMAAAAGHFDEAATEYADFRKQLSTTVPAALAAAEPWSLFASTVHAAHYRALRQMLQAAEGPRR
jgi:hypothetical protein